VAGEGRRLKRKKAKRAQTCSLPSGKDPDTFQERRGHPQPRKRGRQNIRKRSKSQDAGEKGGGTDCTANRREYGLHEPRGDQGSAKNKLDMALFNGVGRQMNREKEREGNSVAKP